jgi:lipid-A-disaccharide synthase
VKIGVVAGEASGDLLGADLITHLKTYYPQAEFIGIAGPKMQAVGCQSIADINDLAVMGLLEVIPSLPRLWRLRKRLLDTFLQEKIDIFIGVDATDFNLNLAKALHRKGIKTVQLKGPSIWAWRKSRLKSILRSVDLLLPLFPFECPIYRAAGMDVDYLGHPLADSIPLNVDKQAARAKLGLPADAKILAVLPGSRKQELQYLADDFIEAAQLCQSKLPGLMCISASANEARREQWQQALVSHDMDIQTFHQQTQTVMMAADVVLLASGTATLEAMLCKRPMVVAYRLSKLTFAILKRMFYAPFISLPNLLAGEQVAPEILQDDVTPEHLADNVLAYFDKNIQQQTEVQFTQLHQALRGRAGLTAAKKIKQLIKEEEQSCQQPTKQKEVA